MDTAQQAAIVANSTMSLSSIAEPRPLPDALSNPEELRPFADVRLIAFDLDGTLIGRPDDEPGPRLTRLFSLVARSNVWLTLATGRTLSGIEAALGRLTGLARVPLVLYNGSVVMQPEQHILVAHRSLAPGVAERVLDLAERLPGTAVYVYCIDPDAELIGGTATIESVFFAGREVSTPTAEFNGMPLRALSTLNLNSARVVAILVEASEADDRSWLAQEIQQITGVSVTSSGSRFLELRPAGSSKAVGVELLCDRLGITSANVLAVGDNDNDVELLSWAALSVCVRQSSPAARRASKFCSSHGAGNAAIEVLEIVRRAQRLFKHGKRDGNSKTAQH